MKKPISLIMIFSLVMLITCSDDEKKDDPKAMNRIIPPDSTIAIDLNSLFNESLPSSTKDSYANLSVMREINSTELTCINKAKALVGWGVLVCYTPFVIPIAIFNVLRTQIPTEASSTKVVWSVTKDGNSASVTAVKNGGEYDWDWTVLINDFTWITGGSMNDLTAGWWQYHKAELDDNADNLILVEWTRADENNYTVKFTNNNDDPAKTDDKGDYLLLTRANAYLSVEFYDVKNSGGDTADAIISWNITSLAGAINLIEGSFPSILDSSCEWNPAD